MKRITSSEKAVKDILDNAKVVPEVFWFDSCDSTNEQARMLAAGKTTGLYLLVANEQTRGRGQMGRVWHSPAQSGLWISILAFPKMPLSEVTKLTVKTAKGIQNYLSDKFSIEATIKYPNDLLVEGRKICGILAESDTIAGADHPEFVVIGAGLNFSTSFPEALADIGTSVREHFDGEFSSRETLVAELFTEIMKETELTP